MNKFTPRLLIICFVALIVFLLIGVALFFIFNSKASDSNHTPAPKQTPAKPQNEQVIKGFNSDIDDEEKPSVQAPKPSNHNLNEGEILTGEDLQVQVPNGYSGKITDDKTSLILSKDGLTSITYREPVRTADVETLLYEFSNTTANQSYSDNADTVLSKSKEIKIKGHEAVILSYEYPASDMARVIVIVLNNKKATYTVTEGPQGQLLTLEKMAISVASQIK